MTETQAHYKVRCSFSKIHGNSLVSVAKISPDGKYIATASSDKTIKLWRLDNTQLTFVRSLVGHTKGISDIDFSSNSKYLASASDDLTIRIWNLEFGETIQILKGHTYHINVLKFHFKGSILVSGSSDESIRIWDLKRSKCLKVLSAHSDPISSLDFSFDGTIIVSGSYDGLIRLFDLETGQCLKTLIYDKSGSSFPVSQVRFSPNSKYILSSSLDGFLRLWDYMNNKVVKTFTNSNSKPVAEKYALSTNFVTFHNESVVCSGDEFGHILFWNIQTKEIVFKLEASTTKSPILQVESFQNGDALVSVSLDGDLTVWDRVNF